MTKMATIKIVGSLWVVMLSLLSATHSFNVQQQSLTRRVTPQPPRSATYTSGKSIVTSQLFPTRSPRQNLNPINRRGGQALQPLSMILDRASGGGGIGSSYYEKLLEKLPSTAVIDAVASSPNERVVAADIATKAGVSLEQAKKDLTALATLSRGDISVSSDGDLVYRFPNNLQSVLSSNSAKYKAIQTFEKVWPTLFWMVRVSFGVALLASVVLIFSTIFFIQTSSSSDDRDNRRDDRRGGGFGGGGMGMWWGPSPFDFFYYRPYGYYGYYGEMEREGRDPDDMGFLESIFSYIFGDGDPNQGLDEKRLSLAAQMIRDNDGAVTAEQLAPYCDAPENPQEVVSKAYVDESFVLPIVTQLDGQPQVTENGDIVYVFPELQVSASSATKKALPTSNSASMILKRAGLPPNASAREIQQLLYMNGISTRGALEKKDLLKILERALPPMTEDEEADLAQDDPTLLQEREYKFSLAPDLFKFLAGGLGVVNLGGALYLGNLLGQYAYYGVQLPSYFGLVQSIYPLLLGYAVLFNVIPIARNFWIGRQNAEIQKRNKARRQWRDLLSAKAGSIKRKLASAAKFRTRQKTLTSQDMIFDTEKTTAQDLQVQRTKDELADFDKLLNDGSSSGSPITSAQKVEDDVKDQPFQ